jgi:hypothetical protein
MVKFIFLFIFQKILDIVFIWIIVSSFFNFITWFFMFVGTNTWLRDNIDSGTQSFIVFFVVFWAFIIFAFLLNTYDDYALLKNYGYWG